MTRFWIGVGLMVVLLAVGLYSAVAIEAAHEPIARKLEQAAQAPASEGATLLKQARQSWQDQWHSTAALVDHAPMDEIDSLFAQACSYARTGQHGDFSSLCLRLAQLIRAAAESHHICWWNFL